MAIDKRLKIYDDQGHDVDYDIMADDVKFMPDGKDLPTKLAEMEEEIGEGGYTPPAGGIPKTDLAQSVQTSLGLADTALQEADKIQLQAAINAVQTALNNLIGGNVQDAIDTFNEVVAFLNGIDTSDPTLKNQLLALNNAITNLGNSLAAVATSGSYNDLSNKPTILSQQQVAGMIEDAIEDLPTGDIPTKVSELDNDEGYIKASQMDNAPTAGSSAPVKSGGIKTALDNLLANITIGQNGNWFVGQTDTNIKAQGPAGNVNITDASQLVTILVNDLTTGGAGNILSAEMGKVLKEAVTTILDSMGEYCFPNGRPTLVWEGPKCNVTQSLTDVTSNFSPSRVDKNGSLEITLSPVDNLHVFLTGDVTVEMGGTDITSTAWNENTGKVTIANVTDDVVITAKSSTYIDGGDLKFQLDGLNRGGTSGHWIDRIGNVDFTLTSCDETNDDHVVFNGTSSTGVAPNGTLIDVAPASATIEVGYSIPNNLADGGVVSFLRNSQDGKVACGLFNSNAGGTNRIYGVCLSQGSGTGAAFAPVICLSSGTKYKKGYLSMRTKAFQNGQTLTGAEAGFFSGDQLLDSTQPASHASNGVRLMSSPSAFYAGSLYYLRIYSRQLTDSEILHNYAIDQKRFNII